MTRILKIKTTGDAEKNLSIAGNVYLFENLTEKILACAIEFHASPGPGFLESLRRIGGGSADR